MSKKKSVAIVLAGGKGKRMKSDVPKQYMELNGYPVLYYALKTFQDSFVDSIVLVTGADQVGYCQKEIVEKYGITKVTKIVVGGTERYYSVYNGIQAIEEAEYVYIHDGARPMLTQAVLEKLRTELMEHEACVVGMPVKDTIKLVDENNLVKDTPDRRKVWMVHTPQAFSYSLIKKAYEQISDLEEQNITDDAMVVENTVGYPVKMIEGSYKNIKITTPEDLDIATLYLNGK